MQILFGTLDIGRPTEAADAVFIAVPDGAIAEVAQHVAPGLRPGTLLAHHAGAVPLDALPVPPQDRAVMWPPMTFMKGQSPHWESMPLAVESDNPDLARLGPEHKSPKHSRLRQIPGALCTSEPFSQATCRQLGSVRLKPTSKRTSSH